MDFQVWSDRIKQKEGQDINLKENKETSLMP